MGQYHPHGDVAIYDALVRMAQDFSLRYPLVDGHGNFGSLDGDSPAAMRYTECRLQRAAPTSCSTSSRRRPSTSGPTTTARTFEPIVLPGAAAAAADERHHRHRGGHGDQHPAAQPGRAGRRAASTSSSDPKLDDQGPAQAHQGPGLPDRRPDPQRARRSCARSTRPGRARFACAASGSSRTEPRGGQQIVVTSIPYTVNKSHAGRAASARWCIERKLPPLVDVRDESTTDVRIVLEIKKDADPELVMAYLYKHTPLQTNFDVNLTCLVPTDNPEVGTPQRLDLKAMLQHFLDFRFEVVTKRFQFELAQLKARLHILEGFEKVYDALDEMIRIIRKSDGKEDAAKKLIARFKLDERAGRRDPRDEALQAGAPRDPGHPEGAQGEARRGEAHRGAAQERQGRAGRVVQDELQELRQALRRQAPHQHRRRRSEEVEFNEEAFIADEDAHGGPHPRRLGQARARAEGPDPDPPARGRRGDGGASPARSRRTWCSSRTSGAAYVTRFNDVPASTGYGDPVQKLFKFDDGERVVGALSLDPRLPRAREADRRCRKQRLRPALRARAARRGRPPAPAAATPGRARATRSSA